MEETQVEQGKAMEIQKKSKLNSEKIWKIWKKDKLNSDKVWKILKNIVKRYGKYGRNY